MKETAHILRKDLTRLQAPMLAWLLVVLLPPVLGLIALVLPARNVELHTLILQACFYDSWLQAIFAVVLTGLVIQQEPLVGNRAFWVTRPIAPLVLMGEKMLFIGLFLVAAPLAAEAASLALQGVTAGDIGLALPDMVLQQAGTLALAALAAVLTPNFAWFLPTTFLICGLKWVVDFWRVIVDFLRDNAPGAAAQLGLADCRWVVGGLISILLCVLLVLHQYLTRRTGRTVLLCLAALALLFGAEQAWKWDFLAPPTFGDEYVNSQVKGYGSQWNGIFTNFTIEPYEALSHPRWHQKDSVVMMGRVKMTGLWPGYDWRFLGTSSKPRNRAYLVLRDQRLKWLARQTLITGFTALNGPSPTAVETALGGPRVVNPEKGQSGVIPFFSMEPDFYRECADEATAIHLPMRFQFFNYRKEAEIPLESGAGFKQGSRSVTVLDVSPQVQGVEVRIQDQAPYLLFDREPKIAPAVRDLDDVVYVLVNPSRQEAFLPEQRSNHWAADLSQAKQPLRVDRQVLKFMGEEGPRGAALDPAWLAGAALVRLRVETRGYYDTDLDMDPFSLKGDGGHFNVPPMGSLSYSLGLPLREQ